MQTTEYGGITNMPTLDELHLGSNVFQIVGFKLCGTSDKQLFGINVAKVREILESKVRINVIPGSPPSVLGTFKLREKILPLIDLSSAIGLSEEQESHDPETNRVILVSEFSNRQIGFLVKDVDRILALPSNEMEKPPIGGNDSWLDFIVFFAKLENENILSILDFEKLSAELGLSSEDILRGTDNIINNHSSIGTKRILLAEDSVFIRNRLVDLLEGPGCHTVEQCVDGLEAWEKLESIATQAESEGKSIDDYVHLISSDIEMPRLDGMALLTKVREDPRFKHLPFVVVSTLSTDEHKKKCLAGGATDYLVKLESDLLLETIAKHAL